MTAQPFISVVIATRRRREQLRQCLASLALQTYPHGRWEVIVVEDGAEEPADEGLREFAGCLTVRYFRQFHAGCGIARNTGAAQARGRYLIFTDDDCLLPADWLSRYAECVERHDDVLIAGRAVNALTGNPFAEASQELSNYILSRANACPGEAALAVGNNLGVPAAGFRGLNGFSPSFFRMAAEERDFCARWLAGGRRIVYAPELVVRHAHRLNLCSFLRQHAHYGSGAFLFHRLEARRRRGRVRLESPGFYVSLFLWPWRVRKGIEAVRMLMLFVLAQAAIAAGYARGYLSRKSLAGEAVVVKASERRLPNTEAILDGKAAMDELARGSRAL